MNATLSDKIESALWLVYEFWDRESILDDSTGPQKQSYVSIWERSRRFGMYLKRGKGNVTLMADPEVIYPQIKKCWHVSKRLEEAGNKFSLRASLSNQPYQKVNFRLLASTAMRGNIPVVWSRLVSVNFSRQLQETNIISAVTIWTLTGWSETSPGLLPFPFVLEMIMGYNTGTMINTDSSGHFLYFEVV